MGPPDLLPFSLSYSAWSLAAEREYKGLQSMLVPQMDGCHFAFAACKIEEACLPVSAEDELCAIWQPVLRLRTRKARASICEYLWKSYGCTFVHSLSHVVMFLFLHEKSWLHHTVIPANVVKITLRKVGGKFLQDSVFYNVFANILYNSFGVTKKGAVSGHFWLFLNFSLSEHCSVVLLFIGLQFFFFCSCVFCLYYKFLKSIYFRPLHRLDMHTGATVFIC